MAVDPGDVRVGLAISDLTGTIARPYKIFQYHSRAQAAERICNEAELNSVDCIVVGVAYDFSGEIGPQARKAMRLVTALRERTPIPVKTWDESGSSERARQDRRGDDMIDAHAAAFILQEFLDAQENRQQL